MSLWRRVVAATHDGALAPSERNGLGALRSELLAAAARVVRAPAAELPVEDASADTVVASLVLCTVPDVAAALAEVRRVLAPGGRLLFLEHVRHRDPARARRQDRLTPVHRALAAGCHPNRPTPDLIAAAGFTVRDLRVEHFPKAARYLQPLVLGSATA
jgi:SAM-dependent methyltransferase